MVVYSAAGANLPPRGRCPRRGRKRNSGDILAYSADFRLVNGLHISKSESYTVSKPFCPYSSSVMKIGCEEPIFMPASPREKLYGTAMRCSAACCRPTLRINNNLSNQFMVPSARAKRSPMRSRRAMASGVSVVPAVSIHWAEATCASLRVCRSILKSATRKAGRPDWR